MAKKTAVDDFGDWLPILAALVSVGILPKSLRPAIATAGTVLLAVSIAKRLGWL